MKIKLLYLPEFLTNPFRGKTNEEKILFIPPLGITTITSLLKDAGIKVGQDDLLIKTINSRKKVHLAIFCDEKNIETLIKEGNIPTMEEEAEKIANLTKLKGFDVIGFSLFGADNPSTVGVALALAKIIKQKYGSIIIGGGEIPPYIKETLLRSELIDYFIHNNFNFPPEFSVLEFCEKFEEGKEEKTPGLEFIKDERIIENPVPHDEEKANKIIKPCFDGLPLNLYTYRMNLNYEGTNHFSDILVLPYRFIKGCPHDCTFCRCSKEPFWTYKKIDEVMEDLQYLSKKYKSKYFFFLNSSINPTSQYVWRLCDEINKKDLQIKWTAPANFAGINKKVLEKLSEGGAKKLIFGLESASQKILDYIKKPLDLKYSEKIMRIAYEIGIWCELDMIFGFPYEYHSDLEITKNFIKKNKKWIGSIYVHRFFLDGLIKDYPERFNIGLRKISFSISSNLRQEGFDEIYGLKWEKRINLSQKMMEEISKHINDSGIVEGGIDPHIIFFLDPLFKKEKNDIKFEIIKKFKWLSIKEGMSLSLKI